MRRYAVVAIAVAMLMGATVRGQELEVGSGNRDSAESVVEVGARVAASLAMQPNATAQRGRRGGRIALGIGMMAGGVALLALKGTILGKVPGESQEDTDMGLTLGSLALIGGGGLALALADTRSPVAGPGMRSRKRHVFGVGPVRRGGGGVFHRVSW